jgi:AraC-like DNA-binding protein
VAGSHFQVDHRHRAIELNLVVRGAGSYVRGNTTYHLKPGTLIWQVPDQQHRLLRSPTLEMWVVSLRPELVDADWLAHISAQPSRLLPGEELVDLDRLLSQVAQDSDEPETYNAGLAYALRRAQRASRASPPAQVRLMHGAVLRALLLLRDQGGGLSLPQLAKAAGVSTAYLSRLLVEHTDRSFVDWRNHLRIERFMRDYRSGTSLLAASLDAGFGSYARFHKTFSAAVGCTPGDWAKQADDRPRAPPGDWPEIASAGLGVPMAAMLSSRQRWLRVLPLAGPAVAAFLGEAFLQRLLATGRSPAKVKRVRFSVDRAGLSPAGIERLVATLRAEDAAGADVFAELIRTHDFPATFATVLDPFELSPTDLVDGLAALLVALWIAVNGAADPGRDQVEAAVRQVEQALLWEPPELDAACLAEVHAAVLCHFVVIYHAVQVARASGASRVHEQLRKSARLLGRQVFGSDLTDIAFAAAGFVPRPDIRKKR